MNTGIGEFIRESRIAYFSMEIGVRSDMPTYSGGLGVLAGDTIKSAADLKLPMVAVTILTKKGYFKQEIDKDGRQIELPEEWDVNRFMTPLQEKISIDIEGRNVHIVSWLYIVESAAGGKVPIIFLDTDIPDNKSEDREITHYLYGGNEVYRLKQEIVLGIGGIRMLDRLGFEIKKYHMNEGHSSLLVLELLKKYRRDIEEVWDEKLIWDIEKVRNLCVFTTHTPIAAGHDKFSYELLQNILSDGISINLIKEFAGGEYLNMTLLALNLSRYINGVAKRHGEVSKGMFPGYEIHAITNGVHSFTWTCDSFKKLYDKYLPGWANEPETFVRIGRIPDDELWNTHMEAKRHLIDYVNQETHTEMNYDILTIGFARRVTAYKRADLLFTDMERLARIGNGKIQIIYAGKAHPKDEPGKMLIKRIIEIKERLNGRIKIIFLKNYNIDLALKLVSGVDVWLNTPQRPLEASGTSGMKASHNGVPNFSVLDGWWIEGHIEGYTGWSIGPSLDTATDLQKDADDLYYKLENIIIPTFYNDRRTWIRIMQNAIGKNAYYFNSHRMMRRYVTEAYIR
ncbi:MAG: alpha-glucan phosphorylase [Nitrospinae bacterium RIFCSPLOWO2_02_FULL_39_110]|nr:MAG: alpha-glucan phosphorylase [Nitrospinae bacterium RIFCSPHIGHO2_12_FULL_39_42]OGW01136.1 MAG: alpha-glucan phosphorylase [Nitrospinae bacterium RIFCSPHIGHO2_02_FULL_39_82]OGW04817.1 MAG: alpha-glucan phosphorylase [Nitrospinae bacterium RIFCSPLOWO2_02_FULL_39_110]OGW06865.1 MAG: alpha-glucan phosphorylase [Nitrospinae bacterium RIFCSPLOWO2_02_39_17]OGW10140.1 MAG: alpha-glucan phosphorylase [Nitrospinae bacterium RIFCSPLOWO2_12_FULL_39_93]OGW11237.1 MAG: alpha-glucan phosphorylase [Nitr